MKKRILVVEDDAALARVVGDNLVFEGFEVAFVADGDLAVSRARAFGPDLVLLDLMLPGRSGFDLFEALHQSGRTPVIVLTARGEKVDKLRGLNLGADDYITKPFRRRELIARVQAFLRRSQSKRAAVSRFGDYELNLAAHKLFRGGKEVELTAKEFRLLEYFVTRQGCALTRDDILNVVWGRSIMVTPRSVDRCVATLRSKIEPDPHTPAFIHTIRDIGYRFEAGQE
jgi:DNA-binding response OmpR family regulator